SARVRYDLGGPLDRCKGGFLDVRGSIDLSSAELFDEHFDEASAEFHYVWLDPEASDLGIHLDVPSLTLRKGRGRIFGSAAIRPGGDEPSRLEPPRDASARAPREKAHRQD